MQRSRGTLSTKPCRRQRCLLHFSLPGKSDSALQLQTVGADVLRAIRLNPCDPAINNRSQRVAVVTTQVSGISCTRGSENCDRWTPGFANNRAATLQCTSVVPCSFFQQREFSPSQSHPVLPTRHRPSRRSRFSRQEKHPDGDTFVEM